MVNRINKGIKYFSIVYVVICFLIYDVDISYSGEKSPDESVYKTIKVTSTIQNIQNAKLIYEVNSFIQQFKISDVQEASRKFIINPDNPEGISDAIKTKQKPIYYIGDFDESDQDYIFNIIAYLLEEGKFILIDKKNNKVIKKIIIKYYKWYEGPTSAGEGRMFLLPDGREFFHMVDLFS